MTDIEWDKGIVFRMRGTSSHPGNLKATINQLLPGIHLVFEKEDSKKFGETIRVEDLERLIRIYKALRGA